MARKLLAIGTILSLVGMVVLTGCDSDSKVAAADDQNAAAQTQSNEPAPQPAPRAEQPQPAPAPRTTTVQAASTTGGAPLVITRSAPSQVRVGRAFKYEITVANQANVALDNVRVTEKVADGVKVEGSAPQAKQSGQTLIWELGKMDAGTSKTITVQANATGAGDINNCANATFTSSSDACVQLTAVMPKLQLTKTAPAEVLVCDEIPVKITVTNTGTGTAEGVKVVDNLPDGLTSNGSSKLEFDAGNLAAGQSREFTATLKADKTGNYNNQASATSSGGLTATAASKTVVRQPVLAVTKSGPAKRYLGTSVAYTITVKNSGDAPARNTVLTDTLGAGTSFVSASDGGQLSGGKVVWNLGDLAPGASKQVSVDTKATQIGKVTNTASASAYCASASDDAVVDVRGIPAILLECVDQRDPIELGGEETYQIVVTNQGSADDTNVKIVVTLPAEQEFVRAAGPTKETVQGKTITFAPLASLAPGAKATWNVVVKGVKTGDVRFKVSMTSDVITSPVEETESTHIYE